MTMKPQRTFTGVEGNNSTGMQGPDALKKDIDTLGKMLDPDAIHDDGSQGGIGEGNLNFDLRGEIEKSDTSDGKPSGAELVGSKAITELKDPDNQALSALTVWKQIKAIVSLIVAHFVNKSNPHEVKKDQIGLGNADNTSDMDKPISNAQASAISTVASSVSSLDSAAVHKTGNETVDGIKHYLKEILLGNNLHPTKIVSNDNGTVDIIVDSGGNNIGLRLTADQTFDNLYYKHYDGNYYKVWHSGNDGPASGLSAQFAALATLAQKATALETPRRISGFAFNGTADIKIIGECATPAADATKVVDFASDFVPSPNVLFGVRFWEGNTANNILLSIAGAAKGIALGGNIFSPLYLRTYQVYLFALNNYRNAYDLIGYESQGNVVLLQDAGGYFASNNAEGAFQEVGAHLITLDGDVAARYTKTEMQTSGSALMHWDNLTNVPNLADDHWRTPVNTPADLPLVGNRINDLRLVGDDGDGKGAGYQCVAITGTLAEQWKKSFDVDWMSEEQTRITQENARVTAEGGRVTAETNRVSAENTREAAELVRKTSETSRISGESSRQTGEQTRFNNEETRKSNETARQNAEVVRAFLHPYDNASTYAGGMKVTYEGSTYQALKASLGNLPTNTEFWICIAQKGDNTTAVAVSYSNTVSGLVANTAQGAIDESAAKITSVETDLTGEIGTTNSNLSQLSDSVTAITNGALFKAVYDKDNSGSVDKADLASNAELLGGNPSAHYQALMINDVIEGGQKTVQALIDRILENSCKAYAWTVLETKYDSWASFEALGLSWNDINEGGY